MTDYALLCSWYFSGPCVALLWYRDIFEVTIRTTFFPVSWYCRLVTRNFCTAYRTRWPGYYCPSFYSLIYFFMNKTLSLIATAVLVMLIVFVFINKPAVTSDTASNVSLRGGVQYVTVHARGGYSPRSSTIQSGIPTKLIVKTDNTYDCSSSLVIHSVNYRGMLPASGETQIDLGTPKSGEKIQ